jgi:Fe-S-cluster containining protein
VADLAALRALYDEVDQLLEGWDCERSADCCHFGRTGREPQLFANEWALIAHALAARPLPKRRGLPVVGEGRCPLLGADDRCAVYAARPFGCRTYFCARAAGPERRPPRRELAAIGRRLAALVEVEAGHRDAGPRALRSWLESIRK